MARGTRSGSKTARKSRAVREARPTDLRALADRMGVVAAYLSQDGSELRKTSDRTRVELLWSLGVDASDAAARKRALAELEERERSQLMPPVRVMRAGRELRNVTLQVPEAPPGATVAYELELSLEGGTSLRASGKGTPLDDGSLQAKLPETPPLGYHNMRCRVSWNGGSREGGQLLIAVPQRCASAHAKLGGDVTFGLIANLYTVRSTADWGVGELSDLRTLMRWAASFRADFVGVNPLHAIRNRGMDISPYSPVSRLFRNPLYIDVREVPEMAESQAARDLLESADFDAERRRLHSSPCVEYERIMALKRPVFLALYGAFVERHAAGDTARGRAFREFVRREGDELTDFATFMALSESFESSMSGWPAWHSWPAGFRDPRSADVLRFREENAAEVDFHRYLQFELDRQLAAAAKGGTGAGMRLGLYEDLAIGSSAAGSDAWSFRDVFARDATIGAPPDEYSASGQNWGIPPNNPHRLRESGYRFWIRLLQSVLRHSGAVRIDHVLGLFRQFWIPDGRKGRDGAYVRFPTDDMFGILALESVRANALVVGEDLGTVPEEVPETLKRWGVLSSRVLYFEKSAAGFHPPSRYEREALTSANTHDMAPLAGHWKARDIELKRRTGIITAAEARRQREQRRRDIRSLVQALKDVGSLPRGSRAASRAPIAAVHDFLCRTPSLLTGLALDDVAGEEEPVNLPGAEPDQYPSWSRRMRLSLEALASSRTATEALKCDRPRKQR